MTPKKTHAVDNFYEGQYPPVHCFERFDVKAFGENQRRIVVVVVTRNHSPLCILNEARAEKSLLAVVLLMGCCK